MNQKQKKLLYLSQHRGIKEIDIFLGLFAKKYIPIMSTSDLKLFENLLHEKDLDLYNWITGLHALPERLNHCVMHSIIKFNTPTTIKKLLDYVQFT